jgi:CHASE3 domain sensor protein
MKYLNVFTSKNNSPKKAQRTLILGSLAILFVLVSFFINTLKVKDTSKLMEHTQEVLRTNDNLLLDAMYLETGSRAFILTSARSYLQPYNASKNTIRINLKKLKHLTQDNSEQLRRLVKADRLITQLLYNSKYAINQKIVTNQTLAEKLVAINRIEETANKTRTIIAEINNAEFQLINLRKSENKTSISNNSFLAKL